MRTTEIRRTGVAVTALGFGTAPIGNLYQPVDDETAMAALAAAWDGGVRYFDTAPHYGLGLAELRLAAALRGRPRAEFRISTKVGRLLVDNPRPTGSDLHTGGFAVPDVLQRRHDYSRDGVRRSLDSSLQRLDVDRVDIVYVHDPEGHMDQAIAESIPALVALRDEGTVGAIGVGMNVVAPLRRFVAECDVDVLMVAGRWTLADRTAGDLLGECGERGVAVAAAAPFNSGLLAQHAPPDDARFNYESASPGLLDLARSLAESCDRYGVELPQAALQFPLLEPSVATVVAGMRTVDQVRSCLGWIGSQISPALWDELRRFEGQEMR